jgi:hypothetical protein
VYFLSSIIIVLIHTIDKSQFSRTSALYFWRSWRRRLSLRYLSDPEAALLDSNVFLSYIKDDDLAVYSEKVVEAILGGMLNAYVSSELYDDVVTALRSRGVPLADVKAVLKGIASIPHTSLSVTLGLCESIRRCFLEKKLISYSR